MAKDTRSRKVTASAQTQLPRPRAVRTVSLNGLTHRAKAGLQRTNGATEPPTVKSATKAKNIASLSQPGKLNSMRKTVQKAPSRASAPIKAKNKNTISVPKSAKAATAKSTTAVKKPKASARSIKIVVKTKPNAPTAKANKSQALTPKNSSPPIKPTQITAPRAASKSTASGSVQSNYAKVAEKQTPAVQSRLSQPTTSPPAGKIMSKSSGVDYHSLVLPDNYRPSDDEDFMSPMQRAYFRAKLQKWKEDIIKETLETLQVLHDDTLQHPDLADRATHETDRALDLRARDRQRKLINKIEQALRRIDDGSYGYCDDTGEPINLRRLDARPVATLSVEAQERHERRERVYRDE